MANQNLEKYDNIFKSVFNNPNALLDQTFTQGNVENWDSVTHLTLVTTLEEEFNIMFDTDNILQMNSYEGGKEILRKLDVQL